MKKLLLILFFLGINIVYAKTYYVATTGNDANPGTVSLPFRNWQKLSDVMIAGDIAYIRGGTYTPTTAINSYIHCLWRNLIGRAGNWITIQNYPGETPVYDFTGIIITANDTWALYVDGCEYLHIKGLRITGLTQITNGIGVSRGMALDNCDSVKVEQCEIDHMGGSGFVVANSINVYYKNCDSHHNADPFSTTSPPYGGADGFSGGYETFTITVYEGCRAWWNSDDGFDFFRTDGLRILKNCWSFWNGYKPGTFIEGGNGEGYKLGPTITDQSGNITKIMTNCMAFENRSNGISQNAGQFRGTFYNNISYKNGRAGYWFGWYPGIIQDFKNNIGYGNLNGNMDDLGQAQGSYNTWNGLVTVNDEDFISIASLGVDGPRQMNGDLPVLNFMKLADLSDLIDAGTDVGLPFSGTAPDMGAFESQYVIVPIGNVFLSGRKSSFSHMLNISVTPIIPIESTHIEYSVNGRDFIFFSTFPPTATAYSFLPPVKGNIFYRVKVTSKSGQILYSNIIAITDNYLIGKKVYVNSGVFSHYRIISTIGQIIKVGMLQSGQNIIDFTPFPGGIYILLLYNDTSSDTKIIIR